MSGESDLLDELAQSVADGASIDWDELERLPATADLRQMLQLLRIVADVAEVHRSAGDEALPPTPDATTHSEARRSDGATILPDAGGEPGRWGHLLLLRKVGEGSFGEVYHAHDIWLDHPVALKLFKANIGGAGPSTRILHEARKLARIRHPNIVSVHGADSHDGRVGFWMDLIEGVTLDRLVTAGRMSAGEASYIGSEVCCALAAVHQAQMVHRDVKAQNVMRANDGGRIMLMDFGAGEFIADMGSTSQAQGTPLYLAPEICVGGAATIQSDIYAAGVLLYYLVSGNFPVSASSVRGLIEAHKRGDRRRLRDMRPDLPDQFVSIVEKAIDPDPARRFASAGEMDAALTGTAIGRRDHLRERDSLSAAQVAVRAAAIVAALTALAGILGFVACRAFEVVLRIDQDFAAALGQYFRTGLQALIPILVYSALPAAAFAMMAGVRFVVKRRVRRVWTWWERRRAALDPTAVAVAIVVVGLACWLGITRVYYDVFVALIELHQAPGTALVDGISFSSRPAHLNYGTYSTCLAFLLVLAAFRWLPRLERCCPDPSTVRLTRWAAIGIALLVLATVTLPRRFVFERFEVVRFADQPAVVIASNDEELLLYDSSRRTSMRVPRNAAELKRTGMTRPIFEP